MLLDGFEQKTMHDFAYFRKDNSATILKNSRKSKTKVESFINDKGEFSVNWTRVSAEEVVMCPVSLMQYMRDGNQCCFFNFWA